MFLPPATNPWYAIRVKSNFEKTVGAMLRGQDYEEFVPCYRSRRVWSDRVKQIDVPLYPGYVFCRFDPSRRAPILTVPGVVNVVGFGDRPTPISDEEIATIRTVTASKLAYGPWPFLETGQRVLINKGPLAGTEGFLVQFRADCRIVVSITLLQRSVAAEIERDWVTPLSHCDRNSQTRQRSWGA